MAMNCRYCDEPIRWWHIFRHGGCRRKAVLEQVKATLENVWYEGKTETSDVGCWPDDGRETRSTLDAVSGSQDECRGPDEGVSRGQYEGREGQDLHDQGYGAKDSPALAGRDTCPDCRDEFVTASIHGSQATHCGETGLGLALFGRLPITIEVSLKQCQCGISIAKKVWQTGQIYRGSVLV